MGIEHKKPGETEKEMGLRLSIFQKTLELMTAAFSLVAALAWNDAIQSLFAKILGPNNGIIVKFFYAVAVTALVVGIAIRLSRVSKAIDRRFNHKDS